MGYKVNFSTRVVARDTGKGEEKKSGNEGTLEGIDSEDQT